MNRKALKLHEDTVAIKAFFLYSKIFYKNDNAFIIPKWFSKAEKSFTKEELQKMYNEIELRKYE